VVEFEVMEIINPEIKKEKEASAQKPEQKPYPIIDDFKIQSRDFKNLAEKQLFAQFAVLKQAEVVKNVSEFLALSENPEFKKLLEMLNNQMTLLEALKFLKQMVEEVDLAKAKEKGLEPKSQQPYSGTVH